MTPCIYIDQTGQKLELRFKEHILCITSSHPQSAYALLILHNAQEYKLWKLLCHATCRIQEQMNEHLGKLLYSILSPTRLLKKKNQEEKKTPLFELTYGTQLQDFISPHLLQSTQLFANYTMAHHSGTYFFNYRFTFPNIATCPTSNTLLTYIIYT